MCFGERLLVDAEDDPVGVVEEFGGAIRMAQGRGQVAAVDHGQGGAGRVPDHVQHAGEGFDAPGDGVELGHHGGGGQVETGEGPGGGAQLPHGGGGAQATAHDVADDQRDLSGPQREDIEPVATHLGAAGAGLVAPRQFETSHGWDVARHERVLQRQRGGSLVVEGTRIRDRARDPAPQFRRGLDILLAVGPRRGDAEPHASEVLPADQQRHHDPGPKPEVPDHRGYARRGGGVEQPVVDVDADRLTGDEHLPRWTPLYIDHFARLWKVQIGRRSG